MDNEERATDLANIQPVDRVLKITHPGTGDDLPLEFTLRSPHDPKVRKVEREWQNARLRKRNMDITVEEFEAVRIKTLTAHVVGWKWLNNSLTLNGEQPEFSPGTCQKMLRDHEWVKDWLEHETGNAARFYNGSETA